MAAIKPKKPTNQKPLAKKAVAKKAAIKKTPEKKAATKKPAADSTEPAKKPRAAIKKSVVPTTARDKHIVEQRYLILKALDDGKAEDIVEFNVQDRSSLADYFLIASGRSTRHVSSLAENVTKAIKQAGHKILNREGEATNDWVIVDTGDIIVHLLRPEVRAYYRLEEIWEK